MCNSYLPEPSWTKSRENQRHNQQPIQHEYRDDTLSWFPGKQ